MIRIKRVFYHIIHLDLLRTLIKQKKIKRLKRIFIDDKINDIGYLIRLGKIRMGYKMDLDNPKTYNEKLNWYKLNYYSPLIKKCVDKIDVKDYVTSLGLNYILLKTYEIYGSINEIRLESLPESFVIKNTIDSGGVYVCKNKSDFSYDEMLYKLNTINSEIINGKHINRELAYEGLKNRIIVEEYLKTPDGHAPWDYKFFCFNGEPKFLFVGSDRDTNVCFDFYDINFMHLDVKQGHPRSKRNIRKPKNFEKMLDICRILSKEFPHVRVDLYNVEGKIYFGELTFYHFAGLTSFKPKKWDYKFGEFFDINVIKSTNQN